MRPLTVSDAENVILALQDEIRRSDESRYDHRLHGLLLVAQGMTAPDVSRMLGDSPRTVQYWVRRFHEEGLAGLAEGDRPGRPRRLTEAQMRSVESALRKSPEDVGLSVGLWDGKTLSAYLQQQFEIDLGVRQCQRLFRQLGFRLRKARPVLSEVPPEVKEGHKKKLRALIEDPSLDLWAMDEVHFQQHGSRCRMGVPPEVRDPILRHAWTHKSVGYRGGGSIARREADPPA